MKVPVHVRGLMKIPVHVRGLMKVPVHVRGLMKVPVHVRGLMKIPVHVRGLMPPCCMKAVQRREIMIQTRYCTNQLSMSALWHYQLLYSIVIAIFTISVAIYNNH